MLVDLLCGAAVIGALGLLVVLGEVIVKLAIKYSDGAEKFFDDLPEWDDD